MLNYVLSSKDFSILSENSIGEEYFSDCLAQYRFIRDHYDTYGVVPDIYTFLDKFSNWDVLEVRESPQFLIDEIHEDRKQRVLASAFNKVREALNSGDVKKAEELYLKSFDTFSSSSGIKATDIYQDTGRYNEYVERMTNIDQYYVSTGIPELDAIIGGFDRRNEIGLVVARTGVGKSWMLDLMARASAEQGLTVGIYSGEMDKNKVAYRIDTLNSHLSNYSMTHGREDIQNEYKRYIDELPNKYKGTIKILEASELGDFASVHDLGAFIDKYKLDILFVDQLSLLKDLSRAKDPTVMAANISKALKKLQVTKKIPIISACQQNRTSTADGVGSEHVSESDRRAQDASFILFVEQKDNLLTLNLNKARDSYDKKKLTYAYDYDKGIFEYMPTEKDALGGSGCDELRDEYESDGENVF
jgi:replicative DNA helicase